MRKKEEGSDVYVQKENKGIFVSWDLRQKRHLLEKEENYLLIGNILHIIRMKRILL